MGPPPRRATVAVTNVAGSPLTEVADVPLITQAGEELAVPATKTYTTQLAAMAVLALVPAGVGRGGPAGWRRVGVGGGGVGVEAACWGCRRRWRRCSRVAPAAEGLAERLVEVDALVVSGRGFAYSTALELALKLKETCYLTAVGLSYADLVHGPIAVVDRRHAGPPGGRRGRADAPGDDRPGPPDRRDRRRRPRHRRRPRVRRRLPVRPPRPSLPEHLAPFALVVPGQLLAEALARAKGLDPDAPRGLDKVTQTDA